LRKLKNKIKHTDIKKIFDESYQDLVVQALRLVKNPETAEDIVQDCFIKIWDKRNNLEISGDKLAYLARMIRNSCLDFLKKRKIETSELNEAYQGSFEVEDVLITKDLQEKIDKTIDSLPEKCRQVFVLSRFEELSYNEISKQLNISKKTVEAHISRALKSLRISLKQFLFILFKAN